MTHEQIKAEAEEIYPNIDAYGLTLAIRNAWIAARTLSIQEREKELSDCWDAAEEIFDKYTSPTGGGYEADYTDKNSFFNELRQKFNLINNKTPQP